MTDTYKTICVEDLFGILIPVSDLEIPDVHHDADCFKPIRRSDRTVESCVFLGQTQHCQFFQTNDFECIQIQENCDGQPPSSQIPQMTSCILDIKTSSGQTMRPIIMKQMSEQFTKLKLKFKDPKKTLADYPIANRRFLSTYSH